MVAQRDRLRSEIRQLRAQLVETRAQMLLQEVGIYDYAHPLDDSDQYKKALTELRAEMKAMVKEGHAFSGTKRWAINGSDREGAKMVSNFGKLMLRSYNAEAESLVKKMRPFQLESSRKRLDKARATISKLCQAMHIEITDGYHELRVRELELTADYHQKREEEREEAREARERAREEAAAQKELKRKRELLEQEQRKYLAALAALREQGDRDAIERVERELANVEDAIKGVVERAANLRAGCVYVISNVGAFGGDVIKIGMTRREDPMVRVRELGDASVPFRFDVHVLIFSKDAVGLENALHKRFAEVRLNLVNRRREFFRTTPAAVKEALLELGGDVLSFNEDAPAEEWTQSEAERARMVQSPESESLLELSDDAVFDLDDDFDDAAIQVESRL